MTSTETTTAPLETPAESSSGSERDADAILHEYLDRDRRIDTLPPEEAAALRRAFEESETITRYREGTTIDDLRSASAALHSEEMMRAVPAEELRHYADQIGHTVRSIELLCGRYAQSIRAIEGMRLRRYHMEDWRVTERLESFDRMRRATHDELIATLNQQYRTLQRLTTTHRVRLPRAAQVPKELRPEAPNDPRRENVGEWAITTDYYLRAQHLLALIEKSGQGENPLPTKPPKYSTSTGHAPDS